MKQSISSRGGACRIPSEEEAETVEILLTLPELIAKNELFSRYPFTWGKKKKRSVLISKSESSPIAPRSPDKLTAANKSPSTPLSFLPCGSASDGYGNLKQILTFRKSLKRKASDVLIEEYRVKHQEREMLIKKIKAMDNHHQELKAQNMELIAKRQQINYPRNMEINHYQHQQMTMFAPSQQENRQQLVVDSNSGKLVAISCSRNSNGGRRTGLFNQIDTRVKIHGETYDFMSLSGPLDQNNCMVMDKDLKVKTAAAARKKRIMRMKENKNSL